MWTGQIERILSHEPVTAPFFGGVFPSNQLPKTVHYGQRVFVANTHPASKPGEHWVAFYFPPEEDTCWYFDSYGFPPLKKSFERFMESNVSDWTFNSQWLQDSRSQLCGHYCIFFAVHACRGMSMKSIVQLFDVNKTFNDMMVADFVKYYYPASETMSSSRNQCCCSAMHSLIPY